MARIITTQTVEKNGFKVINLYSDGSKDVNEFFEDDIVEDFSFVDNREKITVKGRISKVDMSFKRIVTKKYIGKDSCVENDCRLTGIQIDHSLETFAKISNVNPMEILEFKPEKEVKRVNVVPCKKVFLKVTLSDNSTSEVVLREGMKLFNVTIQKYGEERTEDFTVKSFFYKVDEKIYKPVMIGMYLVDNNSELVRVYFEDIKVCGCEGMIVEEDASLTQAIAEFIKNGSEGGIILPANTYNDSLVMNNKINMLGNQANVVANTGVRCSDDVLADETNITNTISCEQGASVIISGVTFTQKSIIATNKASDITFKNCRFLGIEPTANQTQLINGNPNDAEQPVLIRIENCYFGTNVKNDTGAVYNLINLHNKVADGSYIRNCYFAKEVCKHNVINIYNTEEGATIDINDNYFEYSGNAIRLGVYGSTKCTFNIYNNTYADTDVANPEYAGLLLIQPVSTSTTTMANMTINLDNNKCLSNNELQLFYIYSAPTATQINETNCPTIYVDGKLQQLVF